MADRSDRDPGPAIAGLYDVRRLAARLGKEPSTIGTLRRRGTIREPDDWLNNGPVWREETVELIEDELRPPGRPVGSRTRRPATQDQEAGVDSAGRTSTRTSGARRR